MQARQPHDRVVNLGTAVTSHGQPWPRKGINCRMHSGGAPLMGGVDCRHWFPRCCAHSCPATSLRPTDPAPLPRLVRSFGEGGRTGQG